MKNIGLIVAVEIESVLNKYGKPKKQEKINAYNVMTYNVTNDINLHVIHCGAGEIAAAAATQFCISRLNCEMILNFGIVGGLTDDMSVTKMCVVDKVVHYDFDISQGDKNYVVGQYSEYKDPYIPTTKELVKQALKIEPSLKKSIIASGDKFIEFASKKRELHNQFNADICDMESAGIALICNRNKIPFLMLKCVSDGCDDESYNSFSEYFDESSRICFDITDKIIKNLK
jgi:adenosylhomocysteine nucleosidase